MDFSEMQLIWDDQNKRTLFAFDKEVLEREVMKESKSIRIGLRHGDAIRNLDFSQHR